MVSRPSSPRSAASSPSGLIELGLRSGDTVRFRRRDGGRWKEGRVVGREKDGSIGVRDSKGSARALPVEQLEVRVTGPRGGIRWVPVRMRTGPIEQLELF